MTCDALLRPRWWRRALRSIWSPRLSAASREVGSFSLSALAVARSLNSAASKLTAKTDEPPIRLPFFAANWRMGATEKRNSNGKSFWQPTYQLVGTISVTNGRCGRPVLHCFGGGDFRDIIDVLIARGVWPRQR
jgi:hypothetical protein